MANPHGEAAEQGWVTMRHAAVTSAARLCRPNAPALLELTGVSKSFGGIQPVCDLTFPAPAAVRTGSLAKAEGSRRRPAADGPNTKGGAALV